MKHRRTNKTKIKVSKKDRIQSPDDLEFNACCNLVREALISTYETYKKTYAYCHKNRAKYKEIWKEIDEYERYREEKLMYLSCKHKKRKWEDDYQFIKEFESKPKITRPKKNHYEFYWNYLDNRQELDACIWFYRSDRYKVFCLNNYVDGELVMSRAREELRLKGDLK